MRRIDSAISDDPEWPWRSFKPFEMRFLLQLCSSGQDFNWHRASRGPSATAEPIASH